MAARIDGTAMRRRALPATASAAAVLIAGGVVLSVLALGPVSAHMALHIGLMNVAAPLAAALLASAAASARPASLWMATAVQVVLLWTWHAPPMQRLAMESAVAPALMHGSLLLVAVLFWALLLRVAAAARWHGIAALLVTGKLACLLGGLLIFAPRLLHAGAAHAANHGATLPTSELADQHLAGLLMITACPLSYVAAGVVLAAQMMAELERKAVPPAAIVR